jgi:hypothetical protein
VDHAEKVILESPCTCTGKKQLGKKHRRPFFVAHRCIIQVLFFYSTRVKIYISHNFFPVLFFSRKNETLQIYSDLQT